MGTMATRRSPGRCRWNVLCFCFGFDQNHDVVDVVTLIDGLLSVVDGRGLVEFVQRDSQLLRAYVIPILALLLVATLVLRDALGISCHHQPL